MWNILAPPVSSQCKDTPLAKEERNRSVWLQGTYRIRSHRKFGELWELSEAFIGHALGPGPPGHECEQAMVWRGSCQWGGDEQMGDKSPDKCLVQVQPPPRENSFRMGLREGSAGLVWRPLDQDLDSTSQGP